jgi:hypothetical protein
VSNGHANLAIKVGVSRAQQLFVIADGARASLHDQDGSGSPPLQ